MVHEQTVGMTRSKDPDLRIFPGLLSRLVFYVDDHDLVSHVAIVGSLGVVVAPYNARAR